MSRYIDADAIKLEKGFFEKVDNVPKFYEWLGKQPTVDAVPVEWIENYVKWLRKREIQFAPVAIETMLSYFKGSMGFEKGKLERSEHGTTVD